MKKQIITLVFAVILALSVVGCASSGNVPESASEMVATATPEPMPTPTPEPTPSPHVHDWREANYQEPKTCLDCGEAEGEPLPAGFLAHGYSLSELDTPYPYKSVGGSDDSTTIVGQVMFTDYRIIEGDEKREPKEGYEWRVVNAKVEFGYDIIEPHGFNFGYRFIYSMNYYSIDLDSNSTNSITFEREGLDWEVSFHGETYETKIITDILRDEWIGDSYETAVYVIEYEISYLVPIGYDGYLLAFYNPGNGWEDVTPADVIDDDTVWFRLD